MIMLPIIFRYCVLFVFVVLLTCSGCGGPKAPYPVAPLEGTITFRGEPLTEEVTLHFTVGEFRTSIGFIEPGSGGRFKAIHTRDQVGVPVGECVLTVSWGGLGAPPAEYRELFARYGHETDGFVFEVPPRGDRNFVIELE